MNDNINKKAEEQSEFVRSVLSLSPDDIVKDKKKKTPLDFIIDNIRIIILIICGGVLIWSLHYLIGALVHYQMAYEIYNDIGNVVMGNDGNNGAGILLPSIKNPTSPNYSECQDLSSDNLNQIITVKPINAEYEIIRNKLYSIKELYPNLYGWIVLPNTKINYPIMQADDNDYYLDHSYTGSYLRAGAIFADFRCKERLLDNKNLVVYGHHMTDSSMASMFRSLDNFLDEDFFRNNNTVYVYTLDGMYTYKVISVYETNMYYPYIQTSFGSDMSFVKFAREIAGNSIYDSEGYELSTSSHLLTLSTCNNRTEDGRLAVHALLVDIYENS